MTPKRRELIQKSASEANQEQSTPISAFPEEGRVMAESAEKAASATPSNEDLVQVLAPLVQNWAEKEGVKGSDVQKEMFEAINNLSSEQMGEFKEGMRRLAISKSSQDNGYHTNGATPLTEEQQEQQSQDLRDVVSILSGPMVSIIQATVSFI